MIADERSELVVFDINRSSGLAPVRPRVGGHAAVAVEGQQSARRYRRTLVTNVGPDSLDVAAANSGTRRDGSETQPLGSSRGRATSTRSRTSRSRSQCRIRSTDARKSRVASATIRLGVLSPRGEKAVMSVPSDTLMRLTAIRSSAIWTSASPPGSAAHADQPSPSLDRLE